ncbi:MAG: UDP-N-acetylmuramate:L-alanyl-gamma-D-glutamyl-meso-diaminopimelate ligase [Candidatus Kapabacteria bacterium]|nr:UDP-N-acetylmuramate:L-alanyl-gamma-D-glutamyl-meso-diaminopimelate ligase [Candidatus Kapabacteria bacterium]
MHIHFTGIGGTAMGSVAVACRMQGHTVTGSDGPVYEPMRSVLDTAGIERRESFDADILMQEQPDLVVIGNAISRGNPELEAVLDRRLEMTSMAELVGRLFISRNTSIVCCGTHGKTTTSSIAAWLLEHAGRSPGFLIGGVPGNFNVGCRPVPEGIHDTHAGVFVSEGDEYDTAFFDKRSKFVHYRPTIAVINNLEFDHADIFDDLEAIVRSFKQLVRIVPSSGVVLVNGDDANAMRAAAGSPTRVETVGLDESATWRIHDVTEQGDETSWGLSYNDTSYGHFTIAMPGLHNVRNATMAIASTYHAGLNAHEQQLAMPAFVPPKRRLEVLGTWQGAHVIDDFAHHPTAIAATIGALRQKYPAARIHVVFEPRSNTTTRNFFQKELADCFQGAFSVCFGPVNRPERYAENERLDTSRLVQDVQQSGAVALSISADRSSDPSWGADVVSFLTSMVSAGDVVAILSNGNVGGLRQMLVSQG